MAQKIYKCDICGNPCVLISSDIGNIPTTCPYPYSSQGRTNAEFEEV